MTSLPFKILESYDYEVQKSFLESVVNSHSKLPDNPFLGTGLKYQFDEYDWALSGEFWQTVQSLSSRSLDSEVLMAVLEPDPTDYFKVNFGFYGWTRLSVEMSNKEYWDFINQSPPESPADSVLGVAEKIVLIPQSKRWCVWGERESGLCVIASTIHHFENSSKGIEWAVQWCRPWATASYLEQLKLNFKEC
ncbi:MAG: hypothetical protein ACK493_15210 [Planctomycetota bacterium]|jgi:hypothetical protein|nr:hypothetical protein [Blastopirellula sp.]